MGDSCRLYYAAGDAIVTAEILAPSLLLPARYLFHHYEIPRPGGGMSHLPAVSVEPCPSGYVVTCNDAPSLTCGTETEALSALEFALTRAMLASFRDHVHLHASGAVIEGRAVLALGRSGAGKSSLAASWLSQGLPTLGDDIVLLDFAAKAVPFKRMLKLSGAALQALGVDPAATVLWDPEWPEAWYDPDEGPGWAGEAPVAVLAFIRYDPGISLRVAPMSRSEALNAVVHSKMETGKSAGDSFDILLRVVEGAQLFRLDYPSANEAAEAICSLAR